jgi:putative ABC transport system permease protein
VPLYARVVLRHAPVGRAPLARLALARLEGALAETAVSLAAIVVSFSLMVAMAIMVHSFRDSFERWLGEVLPADLYLRIAPGAESAFVTPAAAARVAALAGVARADFSRVLPVLLAADRPPVSLIARPLSAAALARVPWVAPPTADGAADGLPPVYVSEAMQDLYGAGVGATLALPVGGVLRRVRVAGVWRDYARSNGTVLLDRARYVAWSGDDTATEGSVWLAPGADAARVARAVEGALAAGPGLQLLTTDALRTRSLAAFDRAFAITYALEAIAVAIGLAGVAFAFASQALARRGEFGLLRHVGCSRRELTRLLAGEGAALGAVGASYGLLVGAGLSLVLVYVVNRQSFHWSVHFVLPVVPLALAALALVGAAALTARVAARGAFGGSALRAVREDW